MGTTISIVASGVAALIGSFVGALIGLHRFRRERAFDHQLDWYRRATRALEETAANYKMAKGFNESGNKERCSEWLGKARKTAFEAHRLTNEGVLSASAISLRIMEKANEALKKHYEARSDKTKDPDMSKKFEEFGTLYSDLARDLAIEGRKHIGLEPWKNPQATPWRGKLRALLGRVLPCGQGRPKGSSEGDKDEGDDAA